MIKYKHDNIQIPYQQCFAQSKNQLILKLLSEKRCVNDLM